MPHVPASSLLYEQPAPWRLVKSLNAICLVALMALLIHPSTVRAQANPDASLSARDVSRVVGAPRARPLKDGELEKETAKVAALLRCPVCQGLSVADSPSTMARNMRSQTGELLAAGYDQEQVLSYFESSYGEFVRLRPPLRGVNWVVWLAPIAGLLLGCVAVVVTLRRLKRKGKPQSSPAGGSGKESLPDDPELAQYVSAVRRLVDEREGIDVRETGGSAERG